MIAATLVTMIGEADVEVIAKMNMALAAAVGTTTAATTAIMTVVELVEAIAMTTTVDVTMTNATRLILLSTLMVSGRMCGVVTSKKGCD